MTSALTAVVPETSVKLAIQTGDVVAIGVSKIEDEIRIRIRDAEGKLKSCKKDYADAEKALSKAVEKEARQKYGKFLKTYLALCAAFPQERYHGRRKNEAKLQICVGGDGTYEAKIGDDFSTGQVKAETVSDAVKAVVDARDAHAEALKELCAIRSKLTDLPAYERKIRATLATKTLESTAEGRAFLKTIDQGVGNIERLLGTGE